MSRFDNLRLAYRLALAFGAMVLALVAVGAMSVSGIAAEDGGFVIDHQDARLRHVGGCRV